MKETRQSIKRRRECANGHRFTTIEAVVEFNATGRRDRNIADDVVIRGMTMREAAAKHGVKSDSYASRCVRRYYPQYNARVAGQRRRFAGRGVT